MSGQRRTRLLLGAFGLLVLIFAWQKLTPMLFGGGDATPSPSVNPRSADALLDEGEAPPARSGLGSRRREQNAGITDHVVEVRLADLEPSGAEYNSGRNPFAFYLPPPPPPPQPPGPTAAELEARRLVAAEAAAARAAALLLAQNAEPPKPQPPPIPYTYLGRFGPRNRPIAVLAEGEAIHNVLIGDVLDGKFRLVEIGFESVELEYVDFPDVPAARLPVGAEGT